MKSFDGQNSGDQSKDINDGKSLVEGVLTKKLNFSFANSRWKLLIEIFNGHQVFMIQLFLYLNKIFIRFTFFYVLFKVINESKWLNNS